LSEEGYLSPQVSLLPGRVYLSRGPVRGRTWGAPVRWESGIRGELVMAESIQEVIRKFIDDANSKYPDLVEPEQFLTFLNHLYKNARLILARTDFHEWVNEKAEVAAFLTRRIRLNREDVHVRGNPLGHYVVRVYFDDDTKTAEYVEVEWVPRSGVASPQKVFKVTESSTGVPLGELVSTLQSFEV